MTCNWCQQRYPEEVEILPQEGYGQLCWGCYFCLKHGPPRRMDEDKPFTEEQKALERFTANFFDDAVRLARLSARGFRPLPKEAL